jgi:hypothetical protein
MSETNPSKLPWPQDRVGMTTQLKREGCRAIGRMGGKPENFDTVMSVLRVLAHHAEAKLEAQRSGREDAVLSLAVKRADQEKVNDQNAMGMENALHRQRDALDLRIKAMAARKATAKEQWSEVLRKRAAGEEDTSQADAQAEQGIGPATR